MRKAFTYRNYDKFPKIRVDGFDGAIATGWDGIADRLRIACRNKRVLVIDCYVGVEVDRVQTALQARLGGNWLQVADCLKPAAETDAALYDYLGEDRVFGYMCHKPLSVFFDERKLRAMQERVNAGKGLTVVIGVGASLVTYGDVYVYADMARWEIQNRYKAGATNFHTDNADAPFLTKYKRGFFVEWRMCDALKKQAFERFDFVLDTNGTRGAPAKMITGEAFRAGLRQAAQQPFRLVPYFDPGVWGGQWMKEVCDLDRSAKNFAWSFDGVPEENSLYLQCGDDYVEIPAVDLVFYRPCQLLGERAYGRFGDEFPIRFDFLDTMEGGNLSLQVHPLTQYIQATFGMHYTQDESYYLLDCVDDAYVYLGVKEGVDPAQMEKDLYAAQKGAFFDADKYANRVPVHRHSHVLIPAGTLHCSGAGSMVLEISSTPYIFTFKLWDWGRIGLDGLPRPTHVAHGMKNIQFDRTPDWVANELVDRFVTLEETPTVKVEKTGLHAREFIETTRFTCRAQTEVSCCGSVNMCNLVDGSAAVIRATDGSFAPFTVHYAETFIIPAAVGAYTVEPATAGETVMMIRAHVR